MKKLFAVMVLYFIEKNRMGIDIEIKQDFRIYQKENASKLGK